MAAIDFTRDGIYAYFDQVVGVVTNKMGFIGTRELPTIKYDPAANKGYITVGTLLANQEVGLVNGAGYADHTEFCALVNVLFG